MKRLISRIKRVAPFGLLSLLLLVGFQNCKENTGINSLKTSTSSSSTASNASGILNNGSTSTGTTTTTGTATNTPNPCPLELMGSPEISELYVEGSTTVATTVTAKSGYSDISGNLASTPKVTVSLVKTNVTPVDKCSQAADVRCNIAVAAGATGVLWGSRERVPLKNGDIQCVTTTNQLSIGGTKTATITIRPKNTVPDLTATDHVCMQGTATITVSLRNQYNKNSANKTFTVNLENACPEEQKINAESESKALGAFGDSVSISGSRAAVLSSAMDSYGLTNVGGVRIYEKVGTTWTYQTTIIPPSAELEADKKSTSVVLSGNNLIMSNANIGSGSGRAWLFQRDTSGNWNKAQTLNGVTNSRFGTSLAIDGSRVFIGAPGGNGEVQIFTISGSTLTAAGTASGVDANSDFGASLAVSGNRLVVGAPGSAVNVTTTGHFFDCDITSLASPNCTKSVLTDNKLGGEIIPASSKLGSSIALSGNLLIVGARNWYASNADPVPAVRNGLVAFIDLAAGIASAKVIKGGGEEIFGSSVAIAGTSFFVGAKEALGKRGYVDQFAIPAAGAAPTRRFRYYGLEQGPLDRFGASMAISGNTLITGAPLDVEAGYSSAGSATFFTIINP